MAMEMAPSPTGAPVVPPKLTQPSPAYRLWVGLVLASLFLFLVFYVGLVAGTGYLLYLSVVFPIDPSERGQIFLKLAVIASAAMLFLFLLKGLFKRQERSQDGMVEITEAEQPELYAFIRQLCAETRAPFPHRVFLSPEVNAAVFYDTSLLNLILPVKKNLLIGLGLVNVLPMTEFRAVLAHEFGHFSQSSMALGSYVYVVNRIIADMVYGRDFWDDWLHQAKKLDIRLAIIAWILAGLVWVVRLLLTGAFRVINLAESALSRQMEFHADLVAVSVTGSDALVHALSRLELASHALGQAQHDLSAALSQGLYSRDLFHHHSRAIEYLRAQAKDPSLGTPPPLPDDPAQKSRVFEPGQGEPPSMWASHPPNSDREENAKRDYLRSVLDERSSWLLFRDPEKLRERVTSEAYRTGPGLPDGTQLREPSEVQAFIDEEHGETTYDERYHGLYDGRYLTPGNVDEVVAAIRATPWPRERIGQVYTALYAETLKERAEQHYRRMSEHQMLAGLDDGEYKLRGKDFEFRDARYRKGDVKRLREQVEKELEQDSLWLEKFDREVFLVHFQMSCYLGGSESGELLSRYRFHTGAQEILRNLAGEMARMEHVLGYLQTRPDIDEATHNEVMGHFRTARETYGTAIRQAAALPLPPLKNMQAGMPLSSYLAVGAPVAAIAPDQKNINGEWIGAFMEQLGQAIHRVKRVHFKSLGGILSLQERIAAEWREVTGTPKPPAAPGADPSPAS
ncbi:MAG: M48 family metallopeptidase [Armatimonadota bacterium]